MKEILMKRADALVESGDFTPDVATEAIAKDLYDNMVSRIEEAKPELEFDTVHKLALLNSAEFCKQCIESDKYDDTEKMIMALVGRHIMEWFENDFIKQDNA
jgi:TPP-dependent indolepyruvate ferredoxin oxidoreductase alpha subunit